MLRYENRQVPEGINVSHENPLKEFFTLLAGLIAIIAALVFILATLATFLAPLIPFSLEQKLLSTTETARQNENTGSHRDRRIQQYLQSLGTKLAAEMDLPEDMQLNIRYSSEKTVNAYATLGGNILLFRGMLRQLPNENAVAMVLAHEIAHVKLRHPIVAAGRGITVALALASITGLSDNNMVAGLINQIGITSTLGFSRRQENAADSEALLALQRYYGHVNGAEALFEIVQNQSRMNPPEFLSTHPGSAQRIERIRKFASEHPSSGQVTPLPKALRFGSQR